MLLATAKQPQLDCLQLSSGALCILSEQRSGDFADFLHFVLKLVRRKAAKVGDPCQIRDKNSPNSIKLDG